MIFFPYTFIPSLHFHCISMRLNHSINYSCFCIWYKYLGGILQIYNWWNIYMTSFELHHSIILSINCSLVLGLSGPTYFYLLYSKLLLFEFESSNFKHLFFAEILFVGLCILLECKGWEIPCWETPMLRIILSMTEIVLQNSQCTKLLLKLEIFSEKSKVLQPGISICNSLHLPLFFFSTSVYVVIFCGFIFAIEKLLR